MYILFATIGVLTVVVWTIIAVIVIPGLFHTKPLPSGDGDRCKRKGHSPKVSVILAARNEEAAIERTLHSLRQQRYPHFEVIAINDRSDDQTGLIMERVKEQWLQLRVLHIRELPAGWLGKNHALWRGSLEATGEWLLFTDGDIYFHEDALERSVSYVEDERVDHLTVCPRLVINSLWLHALIAFFLFNLILILRPQNARNPHSKAFMGIGAFNMLKKNVYDAVGTHEKICFRPDDDVQLGALVKKSGYRQHFIPAEKFNEVKWYSSVKEMVIGLEKNLLTAFRYSVLLPTLGTIPMIILYLMPFVGLFVTDGWMRLGSLYCVLLMFWMFWLTRRFFFFPLGLFFFMPVSALLFAYTLIRSALLAWKRGGIYWRGTFYSLQDLKEKA